MQEARWRGEMRLTCPKRLKVTKSRQVGFQMVVTLLTMLINRMHLHPALPPSELCIVLGISKMVSAFCVLGIAGYCAGVKANRDRKWFMYNDGFICISEQICKIGTTFMYRVSQKKRCIATFLPPGQYIRQQQPKGN